ncbi:LPXTG cell wall anchor domain-containing protein [Alloscardovia venturai]|uniref:LPXTG cell wall anchor domain-containing protein n=1 Tax=Alloscardovia venturai TaxID=1769421 RepID=A0ABW2Y3F2_9BIFI
MAQTGAQVTSLAVAGLVLAAAGAGLTIRRRWMDIAGKHKA